MFLETHETDRPYCLLCCILFGPLLSKGPHPNCQNWACVSFFFFFRRVPSWLLCHFLPWETYLGSGAAVEGDYRPLSSKPWEETCCTTGYRKTANRRPVIKIHTVSWCAASGGKTSETSGKNTTKLTYWNRTEWVLEKKKKSKKFWVKVWSISWLEFRFQQLLNET